MNLSPKSLDVAYKRLFTKPSRLLQDFKLGLKGIVVWGRAGEELMQTGMAMTRMPPPCRFYGWSLGLIVGYKGKNLYINFFCVVKIFKQLI
jgi:hypothetical protein